MKVDQRREQLLHDAKKIAQGWKGLTEAMDEFLLDLSKYCNESKPKRRK